MKFFFYTNKNIVFDFLGRNIIAPDSVVKDIKRYRTISTASDYFLFVTHKKLDRRSREKGIAEPEFVYPVTLELTALQEKDGRAILVSQGKDSLEYDFCDLHEYNPEKHIGAYLIGEIPFSRVEKIYFDTQDDMDMFSRPSPDYWYPTKKFALLPNDFTESLLLELEETKILSVCGLVPDEILTSYRIRERLRAGLLNFINGTEQWQYGSYIFNMDSRLQQLFELKDKDVTDVLPHYMEMKDKDNVEHVTLVNEAEGQSKEFNQVIYDSIHEILIHQPYNAQKQTDLIIGLLNSICDKITAKCSTTQDSNIVRTAIHEIEKLITGDSGKEPEEILNVIPQSADVLKALLFVAKNPNKYDIFLEALDAYHSDLLTKRRATVLWGILNGLYGMPGEGFNKNNQQLWQFIEAFVCVHEKTILPSLSVAMPEIVIKEGSLLGMRLSEKRIVTTDEIRACILSIPKEKLSDELYSKLFEAAKIDAGSKKKAENKGYTYNIASITLPEIKKGDILNAKTRKVLEQLVKDCKTPVFNKEKLYMDYVEDEKKFAFVFDLEPDFWKETFKEAREK